MPTFLNKILNAFSANASDITDTGVDFAELSVSDLSGGFSIPTNTTPENRFTFVASNTTPNHPTNGQFSVFVSDGNQPLASAKIFKVFTFKEEQQALSVAASLYEQLEPFIDVTSNNGKSRSFFQSGSTVRDLCTLALLHQDWTATHLMAATMKISFTDPKSLYPKEAVFGKLNNQSTQTGLTPLMVALECKNLDFIREVLGGNGLLRDLVDFTLSDKNNRNYVYYGVAFHIIQYPTTDPERERDGALAKIVGNYPEGAKQVDSEGRSALHLAIASRRLDILKFLVNRSIGALEHEPKSVASLLHIAAEVGQLETVQFLLEHAVELVLLKDSKYNATPLHWATTLEVTDALLEAGCDTDQLSSSGETALHVSLRYDRTAVATSLVAFAAKLDTVAPNLGAPLHMVCGGSTIKPNRQIVELLIAYNADVNLKDARGNTPRHLAAVGAQLPPPIDESAPASVRLTNALYSMLGRDDDEKKRREECEAILALLHNVGAKRCEPGKVGCAPGCSSDGSFDGKMPAGFPIFPLVDPCVAECPASSMIDKLLSDTAKSVYDNNPDDYKDRMRMLCLDGGGIRGLISTLVLRNLEGQIGLPITECFDYIGGTSVGGLIALFLIYGKPYGPPFASCSDDKLANMQRMAYWMRRKVFVGSRPYDSVRFENLLKKAFGEDTLFSAISQPMVMVTSVLANRFPSDLVMFRNYSSATELFEQAHPELTSQQVLSTRAAGMSISPSSSSAQLSPVRSTSPPPTTSISMTTGSAVVYGSPSARASSPIPSNGNGNNDDRQLVWKAARATGAAPTYFRASGNYIDGGVMANNPTADAMTEVYQLSAVTRALGFGEDLMTDRYRIGIVVSVGTGREVQHQTPVADLRRPEGIIDVPGLYKSVLAFINLLVDQATVTDGRPVDRSRAWCAQMDSLFYRLSPLFSHHVELDEHDDAVLVRALYETRAYMHSQSDQVSQLASVLRQVALARNPHANDTTYNSRSKMSVEDS